MTDFIALVNNSVLVITWSKPQETDGNVLSYIVTVSSPSSLYHTYVNATRELIYTVSMPQINLGELIQLSTVVPEYYTSLTLSYTQSPMYPT